MSDSEKKPNNPVNINENFQPTTAPRESNNGRDTQQNNYTPTTSENTSPKPPKK